MTFARLRHPALPAALAAALVALVPSAVLDAGPAHRVAVCWAPGSAPATLGPGKTGIGLFQADDGDRWSRTATDGAFLRRGEPTTLTWSVVRDGTSIPGYIGESAAPSDLRAWLGRKYGDEAQWLPLFERVFERWSELSGVTYVHEPADDGSTLGDARGVRGVRADIRIGGHRIDGTSGTLAYNFFPDDGDMVIDTADRFFDNTSNDSRRLRNVIAHENGHGLGLDHVCPIDGTKLMEPSTSTSLDGPQLDDVLAVQRLYGDRFEQNDAPGSATALDDLAPGRTVIDDVSIDGTGDADVYSFRAAPGSRLDVVLLPVGAAYPEGAQRASGSCDAGTTFDALRRADLSVELLGPDGSARVAFADAAREGATEELVGVPLSSGTHFVRVRGDRDDVQLYRLVLDVIDPEDSPTAVDDEAATPAAVPVRVDVLANDGGTAAADVLLEVASQPPNGTAVATGGGVVRYMPSLGFSGTDAFTYQIRDEAGRVTTATVRVAVEEALYAGEARFDADGDLYPDELEQSLGTSPTSPGSRPGAGAPVALEPSRVRAVQRFRRSARDALLLKATLPPGPLVDREGAEVTVSIGGLVRTFTLDRKGRGRDGRNVLRVGSPRDDGTRLKLRLRRADLSGAWSDEGLVADANVRREPRALTAFVLVDGAGYVATLPLTFTVRRAKGKARLDAR